MIYMQVCFKKKLMNGKNIVNLLQISQQNKKNKKSTHYYQKVKWALSILL